MQIGVAGSWEDGLDPWIYRTAEEVGRLIAARGDVLFTGGSGGVMESAMKGAKSRNGLTVGLIPAENLDSYEFAGKYADVHIMTGFGELGRMAPMIHSVDGIIAIAGGAGTLIETAMAYTEKKPVVLIPFEGHTTSCVLKMLEDSYLDYRRLVPFHTAPDAESAVEMLYSLFRAAWEK